MKLIHKIAITCCVFISTTLSYSQERITGNVKDNNSNLNIAYVNIGVKNKNIGTITDKNGDFLLKLNEKINLKDSIYFSHLGYETYVKSVGDFLNASNYTIKLEPSSMALNEVVLSNSKPKKIVQKKLGRSSKGFGLMHFNFYTAYDEDVDDRLSKEVGMKMKIKHDSYIQGLSFNITSNDFKKIKFRINFYNLKNNIPEKLLNTKDIIFSIEKGFVGWFHVSLSEYDLFFEENMEDIVVTIQWLESEKSHEKSKYFSISTAQAFSKKFFYREKAMDKWINGKSKLSFYLNTAIKK
jgi:hypothetical protein